MTFLEIFRDKKSHCSTLKRSGCACSKSGAAFDAHISRTKICVSGFERTEASDCSTVYNEFCAIFEDEFREYGAVSLLELKFSPDLKSLGFFYWLDENTWENVASISFFDLKLVVSDVDFFDGEISAVDFYHRFLRLLKCEVIECK